MSEFPVSANELIATLVKMFQFSKPRISELLRSSLLSMVNKVCDERGKGMDCFDLHFQIPLELYVNAKPDLPKIEKAIHVEIHPLLRTSPDVYVDKVIIAPLIEGKTKILKNYKISTDELLKELEAEKNTMMAVSTGGPKIQSLDAEYKERHRRIEYGLAERLITHPNTYNDLWAWYGKWSSGDLPTYQSRREYINDLFAPLLKLLRHSNSETKEVFTEPTGWSLVDRNLGEMRKRLEEANTEEQFQAVGLLCRETLITLAQYVYDPEKHLSDDKVIPSTTDAKRMLDSYLAIELSGSHNVDARKHAKAALDFANSLQHKRSADFRQTALCAEATISIVNIVAIISGRRDP